jgi:hypothetical protein
MDADQLLSEEDREWRVLCDVFGRVPVDRFEEPSVTPDGWSPKDVMFHVCAWLASCAVVLDRIREGTHIEEAESPEIIDRQNREWFELSREIDARTVKAAFGAARTVARERFGSLPAVGDEAWSWFEESGPLHYRKHVVDLERWLEG